MIIEIAKEILKDFPIYETLPASISGKYHVGETAKEHIETAVNVMKHLCDEFDIRGTEREKLIAATYLHDIGIYAITEKGQVDNPSWKYYKETDFSRCPALMQLHPLVSASLLNRYKDKINEYMLKELKRLVSVHMSHWYPMCPKPNNLNEYLICVADYVASRGTGILEYKEE